MNLRWGLFSVTLTALGAWQCQPTSDALETSKDDVGGSIVGPTAPTDPTQLVGGSSRVSLADRVLVLFNENHPDGRRLAEYYATKRGIASSNLCGVRLPPGGVGTAPELVAARNRIVDDCICVNLPSVPSCGVANIDAVVAASPYTHLAIMRGMPLRLTGHQWFTNSCAEPPCPNNHEPSFDFYLSYLIYRNESNFGPGLQGRVEPDYSYRNAETHFKRALQPGDRMFAYGRVEAMTTERSFALIDRTIESERVGLSGNFFSEGTIPSLRDLAGAHQPVCSDYLTHEPFVFGSPESSWDPTCRYASTDVTLPGAIHRQIPGEVGSPIPVAVNAQILAGNSADNNFMSAFDGFQNLLNWRRSDSSCQPLCEDLATPAERDACRQNSTDYFQELNTDCVGAALGFMGHQFRSWPVQYYGFYPEDWFASGGGSIEKTPPTIVTNGGFKSSRYNDENYAHFGTRSLSTAKGPLRCEGTSRENDCRERIHARLDQEITIPASIPRSETMRLRVVARYRTAQSVGAVLHFRVRNDNKTEARYGTVPMVGGTSSWQLAERTITLEDGATSSIDVTVFTNLGSRARDYVDLDAIEVIHLDTGTHLLDANVGGFANTRHHRTHPGDWASTVIDRLGGVAWWGSSSHHLYAGGSFLHSRDIFGALYRGRTLGESLVHRSGAAGLIFGDPMYRPATADVHFGPNFPTRNDDPDKLVRIYLDTFDLVPIRVSAKNGNDTSWRIEFCDSHDLTSCAGRWTTIESGVGVIDQRPLAWTSFPNDRGYDGTVRVAVWNPSTIDRPIYGTAYFRFSPDNYGGFCAGDFDRDGDVDRVDRGAYRDPCPPFVAFYDVDGDTVFSIEDILDIAELPAGDSRRDPDQDGVEFSNADQALFLDWMCTTPYTLFDELDFDDDGVVDATDEALFDNRVGPCYE